MCIHFKDAEEKRLQFRKFHGIYQAPLGFLDIEKGETI